FTYLKVPDEKLKDKAIESVKERVTSLRQQGFEGGQEEVMQALAEGFSTALSVEFSPGKLFPGELRMAEELKVRKYGSEEWLFRRRLP
ncbi:MAG: lipoate--protein ligase family protein, partial [Thermoplasmata archaeon]